MEILGNKLLLKKSAMEIEKWFVRFTCQWGGGGGNKEYNRTQKVIEKVKAGNEYH